MLRVKKLVTEVLPRPRIVLACLAAAVLLGGTATEASAGSRHRHHAESHHHSRQHHHHARKHHHARHHTAKKKKSWRNAFASLPPEHHRARRHSGRRFSGTASYYGSESGRRTASGARFNPNAMTCAHRSLPFGTKLRVSHRGRSVVVTVNDRGPFVRGRVLDLSKGAARAIGLTHRGVGRVVAEVL